MRFLESF